MQEAAKVEQGMEPRWTGVATNWIALFAKLG